MTGPEIDQYLQRLAAHLPAQLLDQGKFLVWEGRIRASGRLGKVPVAPSGTGGWRAVSASDDRHWLTWEQAARQLRLHDQAGGLSLVLSGSALVTVDLDACVTWASGEPVISFEALRVLRGLGWPDAGYLELSPSLTGLHLIGQGRLAAGPRKHPGAELLDGGIVTVTGQALPGGGVLTLPAGGLADLQASWTNPTIRPSSGFSRHRPSARSTDRTDAQILNRARHSRSGPKFRRLYDFGDTQTDYPTRSEGVAGLIAMLLYWCDGDLARAERLYRQSSLYRPDLDDRPAGPDGRTRLQLTLEQVHSWRRRS